MTTTDTPLHPPAERVAMLDAALAKIRAEAMRAIAKHKPFNSTHEGYAVMLEELDECWDDVKRNYPQGAVEEAVQVGAMAARFIMDIGATLGDKP